MKAVKILLFLISVYVLIPLNSIHAQDNTSLIESWPGAWQGNLQNVVQTDEYLQLNASEAGNTELLHPIFALAGYYQLDFTLDFAPSRSNRLEWTLYQDALENPSFKLLVQMGENGSADQPRLLMEAGNSTEELGAWPLDISSGGSFSISTKIQEDSIWLIAEDSIRCEFPADLPFSEGFTALSMHYTSSNTSAIWIHDVRIKYGLPRLIKTIAYDENIQLSFSQPLTSVDEIRINDQPIEGAQLLNNQVQIPWKDAAIGQSHQIELKMLRFKTQRQLEDLELNLIRPFFPNKNELFISEFLYNASPSRPEFIELYNPTVFPINLADLYVADRRDTVALANDNFYLPPNSYALIVGQEAVYQAPYTYIHPNLPSLNNGGDCITIFSKTSDIDSICYDGDESGRGESLERRALDVSSAFIENWEAGNKTAEMSPGFANTVTQDFEAPAIIDYTFLPPHQIRIKFDERTLVQGEIWASLNGSNESSIFFEELAESQYQLTLPFSIPPNQTMTINIGGFRDIFGNQQAQYSLQLFFSDTPQAEAGDLVINEFLADPPNGAGEFIEIFNAHPTHAFDLARVHVEDASGDRLNLLDIPYELRIIEPGAYLGIANRAVDYGEAHWYTSLFSLNNQREKVILFYDDLPIDSVGWNQLPPNPHPTRTASMERMHPLNHGFDASKWIRNSHDKAHSLGEVNYHFKKDTEAPVVVDVRWQEDQLIIQFDEFVRQTNLSQILLDSEDVSYAIQTSLDNPWEEWVINLAFPTDATEIEISGFEDFSGNELLLTHMKRAFEPKAGDLVINEIFFHPRADPEDGLPDQFEWIELKNASAVDIRLDGLILHQGWNEQGSKNRIELHSVGRPQLAPDSMVLAVVQADSIMLRRWNKPKKSLLMASNRSSLQLSNESGYIYLSTVSEQLLDSVQYQSSWHHSALSPDDRVGRSLERIRPEQSGWVAENWGSSTFAEGHSAGKWNSLSYKPSEIERTEQNRPDTEIWMPYSTFSPNGDAYRERLQVYWRKIPPQARVWAKIFDRNGRLVRTLRDGNRPQFEEILIWDGKNENHQPMPPSPYILWLSWREEQSGERWQAKKVILLSPK